MIKTDTNAFQSNKILDFKKAAKKIAEMKKANKTVGLCHGGFDLLHPGHIRHLESAAKLCDCLFVSITSDKFVSLRKGINRPIFSEKLRAYSVASLSYVDYVIVSDFELATQVVERLKLTYYIKGPDFANKTTPGITAERNKIKAIGGEIRYTNDIKLSTTEIIKYIQDNVKRERLLLVLDRDGTLIEEVEFLGKDNNWKSQVKLKNEVIDFLIYLQAKYDAVKIVVSNQQGIARAYFDSKTLERISSCISNLLKRRGIAIDNWQYCLDVDKKYASSMKSIKFNPRFVKSKTIRKPSPQMITRALQELDMKKENFDKIIVIGNSEDDEKMAKHINAPFINANKKSYEDLKKELDKA